MGGLAMIECCPDCGSGHLRTLGIERTERLGDSCVLVVSGYECKECGCTFREFMVTHWHIEITEHDPIELMFMGATE